MSKLKVKVTQDHIDKGIPEDDGCCPIALAIHDSAIKDGVAVSITDHVIEINDCGRIYYKDTPDDASEFVNAFDDRDPVEPFEFEIDITGHEHHFKTEFVTP